MTKSSLDEDSGFKQFSTPGEGGPHHNSRPLHQNPTICRISQGDGINTNR
jgi:hypothetical protein